MNQFLDLPQTQAMNDAAFVVRLTWDSATQSWRIVVKPVDGGPPRVFVDLESAFFFVSQRCCA